MSKPRVAVHKFSSCDGCQLGILNLEDELLDLVGAIEIAYFPSVVVGGLHIALLMYYLISNKKLPEVTG